MATLSTYLADKLLDHSNGVAPYAMPTVWVALVTTASSPAAPGTEANYTGYTRVALAGLMAAASAQSDTNSSIVPFPSCTGGTNQIVGWFTADAATGGNMLKFGTCSLAVSVGVPPNFPIGNLTFTMA